MPGNLLPRIAQSIRPRPPLTSIAFTITGLINNQCQAFAFAYHSQADYQSHPNDYRLFVQVRGLRGRLYIPLDAHGLQLKLQLPRLEDGRADS